MEKVIAGKLHFIEPEETIGLNNEIFSLEHAESREINRILRDLTARLSVHSQLLHTYHEIVGEFDFINGKAKLAIDINGIYPNLQDGSHIHLIQALHPLLFLYHKKSLKPTIPVNIRLDDKNRISSYFRSQCRRENGNHEDRGSAAAHGAGRIVNSGASTFHARHF